MNGLMVLLGIALVGLILLHLYQEHGAGSKERE